MKHISPFITGTALILVALSGNAQTKIKDGSVTGTPSLAKPGAILDLESNNRALLLPRVALTSTTSWAPLNGSAPGEGGYTIYNTSAATTEGSTAYPVLSGGVGEYYWDGGGWVAKKYNAASAYQEPFQVESTTTKAITNTQNIYQNGNLGLGDFSTSNPLTNLDVRGAARIGGKGFTDPDPLYSSIPFPAAAHTGSVGTNSVAIGYKNTASGNAAFASGLLTNASALGSSALGAGTIASGLFSTAIGSQSTASGLVSIAMGVDSKATGYTSVAIGSGLTSSSFNEVVVGQINAITTGNPTQNVFLDPLFQVGRGYTINGDVYQANALTILKNGNMAVNVGGTEADAKPTELLDIGGVPAPGGGGLKVRNINSAAYTGNIATDKLVVADANGILKTVSRGYSTTAAVATGETWIDGIKKVYRKVYVVTLNASGDAGSITIDPNLGPVLNAEFAMALQGGVYKRAILSGNTYNPSTGVLASLSYSGAGITFPITLNLVVTYVEP